MDLLLSEPYGNTASDAFRFAAARGVLPTWMGTAELGEQEAEILRRAVFSARTTNAVYLEELKSRIERFLANGYNGDQAQLRIELKNILAELGYDPINGFPGDAALGIPAAAPGSLTDLSSDRRINLILDTQMELMAGRGQEQRGTTDIALSLFPAWELVRVRRVRFPRDWQRRWDIAGGRVLKDKTGKVRLIAHKLDAVWSALGDRALFKDAVGVSHPPFAFSSGMAWRGVEAAEWAELMKINGITAGQEVKGSRGQGGGENSRFPLQSTELPAAQISTGGMSRETIDRLKREMAEIEERDGVLTLSRILGAGAAPPPPSSYQPRGRINAAFFEALECAALLAA